MKSPKEIFEEVLDRAKSDDNIVGFYLEGSRGKGAETDQSDYDMGVIVKDSVSSDYLQEFDKYDIEGVDICIYKISEFESLAAWGGPEAWERYAFAHVNSLVDKTGTIQKIINEKGNIPEEELTKYTEDNLHAYLNSFYRSVKANKKGNELASHFYACQSVGNVVNILFALNKRLPPYFDYLSFELNNHPLEQFPWKVDDFKNSIENLLKTGNIKDQKEIVLKVKTICEENNLGHIFEDWGEVLDPILKSSE